MSHRAFINMFYEEAINGKEKTRQSIEPYVSDEALFEHVEMYENAFPRYSIQVEDLVEESDKAVVRAIFKGTHTGEFQGIPPTGRTVNVPFIIIYRIEDGKIAQHWMEANVPSMLTQLGVMTANTQPA